MYRARFAFSRLSCSLSRAHHPFHFGVIAVTVSRSSTIKYSACTVFLLLIVRGYVYIFTDNTRFSSTVLVLAARSLAHQRPYVLHTVPPCQPSGSIFPSHTYAEVTTSASVSFDPSFFPTVRASLPLPPACRKN